MLRREDAWSQREVIDQARGAQAELGWVLDPAYTGSGYATEAVRELLRYCFEDLGVRRVTANCFLDNDASWRLMERVGMRRELHARPRVPAPVRAMARHGRATRSWSTSGRCGRAGSRALDRPAGRRRDCTVVGRGGLAALSGGQHTELVAVGIGHDHPADVALADVDASRSEGDETVDLRLLVTVGRRSEVEVQPVLPGLRRHAADRPR